MMRVIIFFILCNIFVIYAHIYNSSNSVTFANNEGYFGYSVFLQKGQPNKIIIGAPKADTNEIGNIFVYNLENKALISKDVAPESRISNVRSNMLFGATIDGGVEKDDPVLVCAPKFSQTVFYNQDQHYFSNGACYLLSEIKTGFGLYPNSAHTDQLATLKYKYAFGEFGFSSCYNKKTNEFLLGSPGTYHWAGGVVSVLQQQSILPPQTRSLTNNKEFNGKPYEGPFRDELKQDDTAGYSVAIAEFSEGHVDYVIGIPRADELKGEVYIVRNQIKIYTIKEPNLNMGSYFGASLCVLDVNGDGLDDLLVGAPTYNYNDKNNYNDGKVHIYINDKTQFTRIELKSTHRNGQFGTSMANLGKITLDKFDGVAISSPYENNGEGAIYIYYGTTEGQLILWQRISMQGQQTFGFSLSKGVDIDGNKMSDLAVGAYKSGHVTVFKARPVFIYKFRFETINQLFSYKPNQKFDVKYCVMINKLALPVDTTIKLDLDKRLDSNAEKKREIEINGQYCETFSASLKNDNTNEIEPLSLTISATEKNCSTCPLASPTRSSTLKYKIPFIFECANAICAPDIKIQPIFSINELLVGNVNTFTLDVELTNRHDPGYLCKLSLVKPDGISITNAPKNCETDDTTVCSLDNVFKDKQNRKFTFDPQKFDKISDKLNFKLQLNCANYTINATAVLPLKYETRLAVDGSHNEIVYKNANITGNSNGSYIFFISNNQSPIENHAFDIAIPKRLKLLENMDVFFIAQPRFEGSPISCTNDIEYDILIEDTLELNDDMTSKENALDLMNCDDTNIQCMNLHCTFNLKKSEYIRIIIYVQPDIKQILQHYKTTFTVSARATYNSNNLELSTDSSIKFQDTAIEEVNLWLWIIIGIVIGLLILAALIFVAYKFNFFKRAVHEKLLEEQEANDDTMNLTEMTQPDKDA